MYRTIEISWRDFSDRDFILQLFHEKDIKYISTVSLEHKDCYWEIITVFGDYSEIGRIKSNLY